MEIIQTRHQDPEEICLEKKTQEMRFGDKKSLDEIIKIDLQGGTLSQTLNNRLV